MSFEKPNSAIQEARDEVLDRRVPELLHETPIRYQAVLNVNAMY